MTDIFEQLKKRISLEEIVREDFPLRKQGHDFRGDRDDCNSLVVTRDRKSGEAYYYWNSKGHGGDAITWLKNVRGMDTKSAVEYLCGKAGLELPDWSRQEIKAWTAIKAREDVLAVATRVFEGFMKASKAAQEYAHQRGWTAETVEKARLGFSGNATPDEFKVMRDEFASNGIDPESPAAVAILGFRGNVADWAQRYSLTQSISAEDINNGYIAGFMGRPRLIYPHLVFSRVTYLSSRNLAWDGEKLVGEPDKKRKSFNPRKDLIGERQPYFGWNYRADDKKIVIVEGQADAITLAQWGYSPVALMGLALDDFWGKTLVERHQTIYYASDGDEAGQASISGKHGNWPIADTLGPLVQVVRWPVKDANELLQQYLKREKSHARQVARVQLRLDGAQPVAVLALKAASAVRGNADRQQAMERAMEIVAKIPPKTVGLMLKDLVAAAGMKFQDFNRALKAARGESTEDKKDGPVIVEETVGGWFPINEDGSEGYLVELLFDMKKQRAKLAYARIDMNKPAEREIKEAQYLDLPDGRRLEPKVDDNIRYGTVMLPSELGSEKPINELLAMLEFFIRRYFLLDTVLQYKTAALYALFTWLNDAFDALPYLRARGGPGSGKSELMLLIGRVCYRMMITSSLTSLAGYKGMAHLYKGTLMIDEADSVPREHQDEMRALLNGRAMKEQARIITMMETVKSDGSHSYTPTTTYVYGPTLLTMYGPFKDPATESRCLTFDLFQKDVSELLEAGIEPGVVQESMKQEALILRNMLIHWRLKTWMPKLEVPQGVKITIHNVSPRMNQIIRPLKILAYLLKDEGMSKDLDMIAEANYEDELNRRAGSFEAVLLRAVIAASEDPKYAAYVKTGKLKDHGTVRYALYKNLAFIANEIIDNENMNENGSEKKRSDDTVKARTIGDACRDAFRLPVVRTMDGWVVVLDKKKIEIGKLRFGLRELAQPIEEKQVTLL